MKELLRKLTGQGGTTLQNLQPGQRTDLTPEAAQAIHDANSAEAVRRAEKAAQDAAAAAERRAKVQAIRQRLEQKKQ